MKPDLARTTAVKILYGIYEKGQYSNVALNNAFHTTEGLTALDRGFVTELVYGTLKYTICFDWIIQKYSKVPFRKISKWILVILRMGLYQMFRMDKVPVSAACNESVKLAERYGHSGSKGFVNGILRTVLRETEGNLDAFDFPSVGLRYGCPDWMTAALEADYGKETTLEILTAYEEPARFTIRANALQCTREQLLARLTENGFRAMYSAIAEDGILLDRPSDITKVPGFSEGWFYIQGESSMLVGEIAHPAPGSRVLDLCGAPGGKATHMAERMGNRGTVIVGDIFPEKLEKVQESARRLGITILKTVVQDASEAVPAYEEQFDYVIADVPCSGLGILRKKPEIRLQRTEQAVLDLLPLQRQILDQAGRYVKPGGILLYSTCSILKRENQEQVEAFLAQHPEFTLLPESPMTILPQTYGSDGFFIAKLQKKGKKHG